MSQKRNDDESKGRGLGNISLIHGEIKKKKGKLYSYIYEIVWIIMHIDVF